MNYDKYLERNFLLCSLREPSKAPEVSVIQPHTQIMDDNAVIRDSAQITLRNLKLPDYTATERLGVVSNSLLHVAIMNGTLLASFFMATESINHQHLLGLLPAFSAGILTVCSRLEASYQSFSTLGRTKLKTNY